MPFFQYSATDKTGKRVTGTMQAVTADAARDALRLAGLTTLDVTTPGGAPQGVGRQTPRPAATQTVSRPTQQPVLRPQEMPARPVVNLPTASADVPKVKTRPGSDKQLFFLLTQLASFYKSGIAPSQALQHLAAKAPKLYQPSLLYAANRVGEGGRLSDALALYPALYPEHVTGAIRAGETAGYVPQAIERMSLTVHSAQRLNWRAIYFKVMTALMLAVTPISLSVIQGALKSMEKQDAAGGTLPVGSTIVEAIFIQLRANIVWIIAVPIVLTALVYFWKIYPLQGIRHRLALLPPLTGRARVEALLWTMYAMAMGTRAGLSHHQAYQLAVQTIPNRFLRENAVREAANLRENEPVSSALLRSELVPQEFAHMVHNGEIAGDVPGALENVTRAAEAQFEAKDQAAGVWLFILLYIPLAILTVILAGYLMTTFYGSLIDFGLKDT